MSSDKPSPMLLDAVKAQASKFKETKNALESRQRELDAMKADLDARAADLEKQAGRLQAERDDFAKEREQVGAARSSIDKDVAGVRSERDKVASEEKRVADWARTLTDREKSTKESEDRGRRLEHELANHLKDSEAKIEALLEREQLSAQRERALAGTIDRLSVMERGLADRDRKLATREEGLIKLQNERLNALEGREREMLKISEEMYARQKESAAQHESFVELQNTLKEELLRIASEREKLAFKEKSLLDAEKYLAAALEASGIDVPDEPEAETPPQAPPPPPQGEPRPPKPPVPAPPSGGHPTEPLRDEIFEEESAEGKPKMSRAEALERMTRALETAKRARDSGRNVSEIRKTLKQARAAFEGGDYDTASHLAAEILKDLEAVPLTR